MIERGHIEAVSKCHPFFADAPSIFDQRRAGLSASSACLKASKIKPLTILNSVPGARRLATSKDVAERGTCKCLRTL